MVTVTSPWRDGWRLAVGTLTVLPVRPPERVDADVARATALLAPLAFAPVALVASGLWMLIGIFIMKKMINFDI